MKLVRHGPKGREKPGLIDADGRVRDLSGEIGDVAGEVLLPESLARLAQIDPGSLPVVPGLPQSDLRLGPCVGSVGKFICIGLNYADHAAESNLPVPKEPVIFNKWTSAITGPDDTVEIPHGSRKTDWEVELGVVIGTGGKYIEEADALAHVAGYCVINDVSEREYQFDRGGTWDKGKGCDTFGPLGSLAGDAGRGGRRGQPEDVAGGGRHHAAERIDGDDGLRRGAYRQLLQPVHVASAGRRDLDRDAAGRGNGAEARPDLSEGRRGDAAGDRAAGHADCSACCGPERNRRWTCI